MDIGFAGAVLALVFLLFGIFAGVGLGDILAKRCVTRREYLLMNLAIFLAAAVLSAVVYALGLLIAIMLVFGVAAGTIAGLKMGFGESVGIWKFADEHLGANKDQVRRAKNPEHAEAVRRARRDGTPEPEFISVQEGGPAGKDAKRR